MKLGLTLLFIVLFFLPVTGFTERPPTLVRASRPTPTTTWTGALEFRPSFATSEDKVYGDNRAELALRITPHASIGYSQYFSNNFLNNNPALEDGPQLAFGDGYLFSKLTNLWRSGRTSLGLEPRVYLPTDQNLRDKGMLSRVRTHINLVHSFSRSYELHLSEAPIFHIFDRSGSGSETLEFEANPDFENIVDVAQLIRFSRQVSAWVPLRLQSTRFENFRAGAKNNDRWSHKLTLYPELRWMLSNHMMLGLAYETKNLMTDTLSSFQISEGVSAGHSQVIFRMMF